MTKRIVFVCIENSNRSQMAEAFARMHGKADVEAYSSGSRPSGIINSRAIQFMKERGYDLTIASFQAADRNPQRAPLTQPSPWAAAMNVRWSMQSSAKIGAFPTRNICQTKSSARYVI